MTCSAQVGFFRRFWQCQVSQSQFCSMFPHVSFQLESMFVRHFDRNNDGCISKQESWWASKCFFWTLVHVREIQNLCPTTLKLNSTCTSFHWKPMANDVKELHEALKEGDELGDLQLGRSFFVLETVGRVAARCLPESR